MKSEIERWQISPKVYRRAFGLINWRDDHTEAKLTILPTINCAAVVADVRSVTSLSCVSLAKYYLFCAYLRFAQLGDTVTATVIEVLAVFFGQRATDQYALTYLSGTERVD